MPVRVACEAAGAGARAARIRLAGDTVPAPGSEVELFNAEIDPGL
jgi:hypothetical protein